MLNKECRHIKDDLVNDHGMDAFSDINFHVINWNESMQVISFQGAVKNGYIYIYLYIFSVSLFSS